MASCPTWAVLKLSFRRRTSGWNSCLCTLFPSVMAEIWMRWSLLLQDLIIMALYGVTWVLLKLFPNTLSTQSLKQATFNPNSHYQWGSFHSLVFGNNFIVWIAKPLLVMWGLWFVLCISSSLGDNCQNHAMYRTGKDPQVIIQEQWSTIGPSPQCLSALLTVLFR